MRVVVALGGNALLRRGETADSEIQESHIESAIAALAPIAAEHEVLIVHGNGPQVGMLAVESAQDPVLSHPYPFDVLVAQTQGMIGNWLVRELRNALPDHPVTCLVSQILVQADDPAFHNPTKFIGPAYPDDVAAELVRKWGWEVRRDGSNLRRVIASPEPVSILDLSVIKQLVASGTTVVVDGGGGVPVVRDAVGRLQGVEAVVDKDLVAELLAAQIGADRLLLLTDVNAVQVRYGTADAADLHRVTPDTLRLHSFAAGSMGPKVEAACRFVETSGGTAAIGNLDDAIGLFEGWSGTIIEPDKE